MTNFSFILDSLQGRDSLQWNSSFQLWIQLHPFAQRQDAGGGFEGCVYGRLLIQRSLNYVDAIRTEMTDRSTTFQTYYSSVRLTFIILSDLIPCFSCYIISSLFRHFLANLAAIIKYMRARMLLALWLFDNKRFNRTT